MTREFKLPDVGEGVAEGEIVQWLVSVGDAVEEDQPVVEVETDKAIVEIPSPVNGTVTEIRADEGDVVPVGDVIIVFEEDGIEPAADETTDATAEAEAADESESTTEAVEGTDPEPAPEPEGDGHRTDRVFAPPHVRRLARELDINLASVDGSGPGGRVTEDDVRAAADGDADVVDVEDASEPPTDTGTESVTPDAADRESAPSTAARPAARDRTLAAPATRRIARERNVDIDDVPAVEEREGEAFVTPDAVIEYAEAQQRAQTADTTAIAAGEDRERDERVPYRGIRRSIGQQMERSAYTAPHVTHFDEIDVTELVDTRHELKPHAEERGIRLTYMPFVMKAVVAALKEHPYVNASLDEDNEEIVLKRYYNIGVATATDDGLLVPVVDDVDHKGVLQIASELDELAQRARDRSIAREELQGGTFTITNIGAIRGEYGTPIINYPEVAILALGAIKQRPWVVDGEVVPRYTLPVSLSFDHRVLDGATGARFVNRLAEYLQNPTLLLLE